MEVLYLLAQGDSITESVSPPSYFNQFVTDVSPSYPTLNAAAGGQTLAGLFGSQAASDDSHYAGPTSIYTLLIGTNDWQNGPPTPAAFTASLATYVNDRKVVGWSVGLATLTPRSIAEGGIAFNAWRATVNSIIRARGQGLNYDFLIDFASNPIMGPDFAAESTLLYSDGLHPTNLGQSILETVYAPAIGAFSHPPNLGSRMSLGIGLGISLVG